MVSVFSLIPRISFHISVSFILHLTRYGSCLVSSTCTTCLYVSSATSNRNSCIALMMLEMF